jgi:hypothetical protein
MTYGKESNEAIDRTYGIATQIPAALKDDE